MTFPARPWMLFAPGVWLTTALAAMMTFVLRNTIFGRCAFALGSNEAAARACGIATDRLKVSIYGVAGLFFGLAGVTQVSRLRQGGYRYLLFDVFESESDDAWGNTFYSEIEISDELLKKAKATAALRGESLREFISHALEARLASTSQPSSPRCGWRTVFGRAKPSTVQHIDKLLAEEFEHVDSTKWR